MTPSPPIGAAPGASSDSSRWGVALDALPEGLRAAFVVLGPDAEDRRWEEAQRPHSAVAAFARSLLRRTMSDFDANGLLGMHPMRLLGTSQWRALFAHAERSPRSTLLDVGAGDGGVTATLAPLFHEVVATET